MATLPLTEGTEILYPHTPERNTNNVVHRTDNNRWKGGLKNQSLQERKAIVLSFRIKRGGDIYKDFVSFLHTNFNTDITLTKAGTDFFGDGNTSHTVRCLGYDSPVRELANWYRIDVKFLKV